MLKHKCNCGLIANVRKSYDPTRTLTLRNRFVADMTRRFKLIKKMVRKLVVEYDVFGLKKQPGLSLFANAPGPRAFAFRTDSQKVVNFMDWLKEMEDKHVLEVFSRNGTKIVGHSGWENLYIESSYKKGVERAYLEMKKINLEIDSALGLSFLGPIHADAVGLLYTRVFNELKGVTDAMDQQMSRVLAEGLVNGLGVYEIARDLDKVVDNIGINRARTIARTEIIRAHHIATINSYKSAGLKNVKILAEWSTALDARVCPLCAPLEGTIWPLNRAEGMIPRHPNCRCVALPYLPDVEVEPSGPGLKEAVQKSLSGEKRSSWLGAGILGKK